jgi:hypothetical protein
MRSIKIMRVVLLMTLLMISASSVRANGRLEGRLLDNVVAFARLVGYVRYFYAGDVAAETNWDTFTIQHIEAVEDAPDDDALAQRLNILFQPYAPTLRVVVTGTAVETPPVPENADTVTMWVHLPLGVGTSARLYSGERITVPLGQAIIEYRHPTYLSWVESPPVLPVPDPGAFYVADLGAGVSMYLPLTVYRNEAGTLPVVPVPAPPDTTPSDGERAVRLASVIKAWNAMQHFFSYWDQLEAVDWEAELRDALAEMSAAASRAEEQQILRRMMAHLNDGHGYVATGAMPTPAPYSLPFTWDIVEGSLVVTTVLDAAPVAVGDLIETINGRPAMDVIQQQLEVTSPSGGFGVFQALTALSTGPRDGVVTLRVVPLSGEAPYMVEVAFSLRNQQRAELEWRETRPATIADFGDGVFYVDATRLTDGALQRAMPQLSAARGLVVDMRGYPRNFSPMTLIAHLTDVPLRSPPFWIPVVTRPDHLDMQFVDVSYEVVQPASPRLTLNIAWITNANGTFSYAESILGTVEGYRIGEIVGQTTAGANGNRVALDLPSSLYIGWTGLHVTKYDGSPLYGVGVTPTVPVTRTLEGVAANRDELLGAALAIVRDSL